MNRLVDSIEGKNVLFITTKELSYLRNVQEVELIKQHAKNITVVGSFSGNYLVRVLKAYWGSIKHCITGSHQVIFVGFSPQLMRPLFWLYRRRRRILAIDFFISLYDTFAYDRKRFKPDSISAKLLKRLDRKTLEKADIFLADTHTHKDYFVSEFQIDAEKGCVLYLRADSSIYYPRGLESPAGQFTVLYFGSVLPLQGVEFVLEAARLLEGYPAIHFVLIGPLGKLKDSKDLALPNATMYSWLSQEELAQQIDRANVCLAGHFQDQIEKAKRTIAGKTYIYRAMNKPVILGDNRANRELFSEEDRDIYYVPMGSSQAIVDKILELVQGSLSGEVE